MGGANPQHTITIDQQTLDGCGIELRIQSGRHDVSPVHAHQADLCAEPDTAAHAHHVLDDHPWLLRQILLHAGHCCRFDAAVASAALPKPAYPQRLAVPQQAESRSAVASQRHDLAVLHATDSIGGAEQRRAAASVGDRVDRRPTQRSEVPVALAQQPMRTAKPDLSVRICPCRGQHAGVDAGGGAVVGDKARSIKARYRALRGDPKKPGVVLGHVEHGDLRQALGHTPVIQHVSVKRHPGVHCPCRRPAEHATQRSKRHRAEPA